MKKVYIYRNTRLKRDSSFFPTQGSDLVFLRRLSRHLTLPPKRLTDPGEWSCRGFLPPPIVRMSTRVRPHWLLYGDVSVVFFCSFQCLCRSSQVSTLRRSVHVRRPTARPNSPHSVSVLLLNEWSFVHLGLLSIHPSRLGMSRLGGCHKENVKRHGPGSKLSLLTCPGRIPALPRLTLDVRTLYLRLYLVPGKTECCRPLRHNSNKKNLPWPTGSCWCLVLRERRRFFFVHTFCCCFFVLITP